MNAQNPKHSTDRVPCNHLTSPKDDAQVVFVREITARYIGPRRRPVKINGPEAAAEFMRSLLRDNAREHFLAMYLDASHVVAAFSIVSVGTANSAPVHPREVYQPAILAGACAVIVGHNHPSGDVTPSQDDLKVTHQLKDAGEILGIKLLDHIILGFDSHVSLKDAGHFAQHAIFMLDTESPSARFNPALVR